jgi:hypothetical protein
MGPEKIINKPEKVLLTTSQNKLTLLLQQGLPCPHQSKQRVRTQFRNTQD